MNLLHRGCSGFQEFRDDVVNCLPDPLLEASPSLLLKVYSVLQMMPSDSRGLVLQASSAELSKFSMTFDSGADTHVLSLAAAHALFEKKTVSNLRIIGVCGNPLPANMMGKLIITVQDPKSLERFTIDLGVAHAMDNCPMNLLSVSLLIKAGATVHFERGKSYFQAYPGAAPISFIEKGGMFQLVAEKGLSSALDDSDTSLSFACHNQVFGVAADLSVWHQRVRHLSMKDLSRIEKHNLVDGFKLRGRISPTSCGCDACRQAKIKRAPEHDTRAHPNVATYVGESVSTDTKEVPYASLQGYRYVVVFVDQFSKLSFIYFLRSKSESTAVLRQYVADMKRLKVSVRTIYSDRGSEFFEQDGDTLLDRDRRMHDFRRCCEEHGIKHVVRPVENKEKHAEVFFRDHFRAVDTMLWAARLAPCLWPQALGYSVFIFNRTPLESLGGYAPLQLVTGVKPRWDHLKVWGCTAYEHIPNDKFGKVPGIPRGRKLIFVGFDPSASGFMLFDPETRRFFSSVNVYFYENFSERIDALRHHDRRRELLRKGLPQPVILDDFDDPQSTAVRSLYLSPEAAPPDHSSKPSADAEASGGGASAPDSTVPSPHEKVINSPRASAAPSTSIAKPDQLAEDIRWPESSPLSSRARRAEQARKAAQSHVMLRPLRLTPVKVVVSRTPEDDAFINFALLQNIPVVFESPCPKNKDSVAGRRYLKYMRAKTLRGALELGATRGDLNWDYERAFISFPKHEPDLPGHIFSAVELARAHHFTHALEDMGCYLPRSVSLNTIISRAFNVRGTNSFHSILETVYEPENLVHQLEDEFTRHSFAAQQMSKVLNSSGINIDFSLSAEPSRYEDVMPEVCPEHASWRAAMDEEMRSMERFCVYNRVPRSAAKGRQILGCGWVYKRKVNKLGEVSRYRGRLVARGCSQRPYDSFDPDHTYSPVCHKDSLRLFLSVCAAENLEVRKCDVTAAFLQADLKEKIFMRMPPGYSSTIDGEEAIMELNRAVYGLKQASASFYTAMDSHLKAKGFVPTLGDPCLYRRVNSNGSVILACLYVDDLLYGVADSASADVFLAELRERFEIAEGEGAPADFVLGMAIKQDIPQGIIHLSMELAITKLVGSLLTPEEITKSSSVDTPMHACGLQKQTERTVSKDTFDYLSVIGSLLHIANCVRCDIAHAVGVLARHAMFPGVSHVRAAKRVLMYLYNTRNLGIIYRRDNTARNVPRMFEGAKHPLDNGSNLLRTFADSDYAADDTRRSTMGIIVFLNGGPISWTSTLGKTVATSTCEAEVNAACVAAKDALHIQRLLSDLALAPADRPVMIEEDNAACIAQATSGLRHVRAAKHYEVRLRFLQQLVVDKHVTFNYCPTGSQFADFMTKPLESILFARFRDATLSVYPAQ